MSHKGKAERKWKRKEAENMRESVTYVQSLKVGTGWRVKKKQEEEVICSLVYKPIIYIEPIPRYKIEILMDEYPNLEWLGYLVGKVSEKKNIFIEDLVIPPHKEVSAASAEAEPFNTPDNCVGIIHSHHHMGAFRSGTDMNYVDKNFLISVIVSKNSNGLVFDVVNSQKTPCGKTITGKSNIKYVRPEPPFEVKPFLDKAKSNIEVGKATYATLPYLGGQLINEVYYPTIDNRATGSPLYRQASDVHASKSLYVNKGGVVMTQKEWDKLDLEEI